MRYYFTQIRTEAVNDGLRSIPSIIRATIPALSKAYLKWEIQRCG